MPFQTLAGGCQVLALLQTSQRRSWLPVYALGDMFWYGNLKQIACTDLCAEELWKLMTKVLLFANMVPVDYSGFLETSAPSATYWKFLCNFSETWIAIFRKFIWTNSLPRFPLLSNSVVLQAWPEPHPFSEVGLYGSRPALPSRTLSKVKNNNFVLYNMVATSHTWLQSTCCG